MIEIQRTTRHKNGQSLVEATVVLLVFFMFLFSVIDCGQVLVAHQSLVERVRMAVRRGVVRPWDGTGDEIANLILYNQLQEPPSATTAYLGLTRANVQVRYRSSPPANPDDQILSAAIVNYEYHFFSPWFTTTFINPRPVVISAPMAYRMTATQ